jgi:hypothetical protein
MSSRHTNFQARTYTNPRFTTRQKWSRIATFRRRFARDQENPVRGDRDRNLTGKAAPRDAATRPRQRSLVEDKERQG